MGKKTATESFVYLVQGWHYEDWEQTGPDSYDIDGDSSTVSVVHGAFLDEKQASEEARKYVREFEPAEDSLGPINSVVVLKIRVGSLNDARAVEYVKLSGD